MGFFKFKAPKIKFKAPKIKLGDPTKLITKPLEGAQNAVTSVIKSGVGNVGDVLSTPGAAPLLAGAATAFGGPEAGLLVGNLTSGFAKKPQADIAQDNYAQTSEAPVINAQSSKNNLALYGIAGAGLILVLFLFGMKKGSK